MNNKNMSFLQEQSFLKRKAKKLEATLSETGFFVLLNGDVK